MKTTWDIEQRAVGWTVIRVDDCGVVAGVPTRPFRTRERWFMRFSSALRYATDRAGTVLAVRLVSGRRAA
jgi:hypothetical protein